MYQRYSPKQSYSNSVKQTPVNTYKQQNPPETQPKQKPVPPKNPLLSFIPSSIYNPETKKVLGVLSAEDLLLIALILILLDNRCDDDKMLIYALAYVLISEYIDLPF